ncbi:S-layer homology domain-containing protein [Lentibacillus sp. Marseille-P4043]|uniref:S-layer homology domain-containing protein n=1 Tax=Lentibacillus sp. Marseille-P4043 TaxID=2040293 RepID=UPI000D0B7C09|nr:S-layer homology domain-containing protein [Lentibacillus sp. Marseille-P4043]
MSKNKIKYKKLLASTVSVAVAVGTPAIGSVSAETSSGYSDLKSGDQGFNEVKSLVEQGIIHGYEDGNFVPYADISRQHVAVMLTEALDLPIPNNISEILSIYDDVDENHMYAGQIAAVTEANIFKGNNGSFLPDEPIKRDQMATVLVQAYGLPATHTDVDFTDLNKIDNSHRENVKILAQHNITMGKQNEDGSRYYDGTDNLKRVQFAIFLDKMMEQDKTLGVITDVSDNTITIDGQKYEVSEQLTSILTNEALIDSYIQFEVSGDKLTEITYLDIRNNGTASDSLMIDGQDATINGHVIVSGDYISLENITIQEDLVLGDAEDSSFFANHITVNGHTIISSDEQKTTILSSRSIAANLSKNELEFKDAELNKVDIGLKNSNIQFTGTTNVNEMNIHSDSTVTLGLNVKLKEVFIPEGSDISEVITNFNNVKNNIGTINGKDNQGDSNTGGGTSVPPAPITPPSNNSGEITLNQLSLSDDVFLQGSDEQLVIRIQADAEDNNGNYSIELWNDGEKQETLLDDGNVDNGDDISNDGTYSASLDLSDYDTGKYNFKIVSKSNGQVKSESEEFIIYIVEPLTAEQVKEITTLSSEMSDVGNDIVANAESVDSAKEDIVKAYSENESVAEADSSESNGVWYASTNGTLGGYAVIDDAENNSSDSESTTASLSSFSTDQSSHLASASEQEYIGNNKVLMISPFADVEGDMNLPNADINSIESNLTDNGFTVKNVPGTIDELKEIPEYGVVVWNTHGTTLFGKELKGESFNNLDDIFLENAEKAVLLTSQEVSDEKNEEYQKDLKQGKIVTVNGYYAITPAFAKKYWRDMANTAFINASAYSSANDSLSKVLEKNGVKTYLGFNGSKVNTGLVSDFITELLAGSTTGQAFSQIENEDVTLSGSENLSINLSGLDNGSFETGTTAGWYGNGDVRVISKLGEENEDGVELKPTNGDYMAIVSTGLGSLDNDSDSWIERTFEIPEDANALQFDYNVVSEEPMEFIGSQFNDQFKATIETKEGEFTLANESVNESDWVQQVNVDLPGGDKTAFATDWKKVTYDVEAYQGETVTLKFHTWDEGDSIYDTAVLLDNIQFNDSTFESLEVTGDDKLYFGSNTNFLNAEFKDQYGSVLTTNNIAIEWSLAEDVEGISINAETGDITVDGEVEPGTEVTVVATSDELKAEKKLAVVEGIFAESVSAENNDISLVNVTFPEGANLSEEDLLGSEITFDASLDSSVVIEAEYKSIDGNTALYEVKGDEYLVPGFPYGLSSDTLVFSKDYTVTLEAVQEEQDDVSVLTLDNIEKGYVVVGEDLLATSLMDGSIYLAPKGEDYTTGTKVEATAGEQVQLNTNDLVSGTYEVTFESDNGDLEEHGPVYIIEPTEIIKFGTGDEVLEVDSDDYQVTAADGIKVNEVLEGLTGAETSSIIIQEFDGSAWQDLDPSSEAELVETEATPAEGNHRILVTSEEADEQVYEIIISETSEETVASTLTIGDTFNLQNGVVEII